MKPKNRIKLALFMLMVILFSTIFPVTEEAGFVITPVVETAYAADNFEDGSYVLRVGTQDVKDKGVISLKGDSTVQLMRVGSDGVVKPIEVATGGAFTISWTTTNNNVVRATGVDNGSGRLDYCGLEILGVGFDNLSAKITYKDPGGTEKTLNLSWTINVSLAVMSNTKDTAGNVIGNIVKDNGYNDGRYGFRYVYGTDKVMNTIQISGPNAGDEKGKTEPNKKFDTFFLKLVHVNYVVTKDGVTRRLSNQTTIDELKQYPELYNQLANMAWESSDTDVAVVEAGVITAKGAGKTEITVTTTAASGETDSVKVTVIVRPTGYMAKPGVTNPTYISTVQETTDGGNFTLGTDSLNASKLIWTVHHKDISGKIIDITKSDLMNVQIYETSGEAYFSNVKAGTYFITVRPSSDYLETNTNVDKLVFKIMVPIILPKGPILMNVDDIYDIIQGSTIPDPSWYRFTASPANIVDVSALGVITAKFKGQTTVNMELVKTPDLEEYFSKEDIAKLPDKGTLAVEVIDALSLSQSNAVIYVGDTLPLQAYTSNPAPVKWTSSNESIASVDPKTGLVKGLKAGDAIITATQIVDNVSKIKTCQVKVIQTVTGITLNPKTANMAIGQNLTISAKVEPSLNGAKLTWKSSDESIVAFDSQGDLAATVRAVKGGTAFITAINAANVTVGSCMITVYEPIKGIVLSQTNVVVPLASKWFQLHATITPLTAKDQEVIWTSTDPTVVKVDQTGMVTLLKEGKAAIVATAKVDASITAICNVTVTKAISGLTLDTTSKNMFVGESYRLTHTIKPSDASNSAVTWTSTNTAVATVNGGLVVAKGVGQTIIICKSVDGGFIATCTINVGRTATAVKLDVTQLALNAGDYYNLEAILTPADSTETALIWESSDTKVATVSKKGKVTAKSAGICIIAVKTKSGSTGFCTVKVFQGATGIAISSKEETITVGDEIELEAEVLPATATEQGVSWESSDTGIAEVDEKGVVTGVSGGIAIITCISDDGGFLDYCTVYVEEMITEIVLNKTSYKLGLGKTFQLTATISGEKATNKQLSWSSSDDSIVSVTEKGKIKGEKLGTATITCTATDGSEAEATCEIRVVRLVTSIDLNTSYITLVQGKSYTLKATVSPSNATYRTPLWSSDKKDIAIVNKAGVVTALSPGDCIITAKANDSSEVSAICYVRVIAPVASTGVTVAESEIVMSPGETKTVGISVVPNNSTDSFSWSSDNNIVATVDEKTGRITAKAVGTANITVMTESGRRGTVKVYVVGLSRTGVTLEQYTSLLINLEVDGSGSAANLNVRWDVDNQEIATVQNGKITARALGNTTVHAIVNGRRLSCKVTVVKIGEGANQ